MRLAMRLFVAILVLGLSASALCKEKVEEKPKVEVVFVLDTTGSMGGLIAGAKAKIWFIAEQIVTGEPTPEVRMGLVPYRDKGDEYVTKVFDLTDNIDQVYTDLMDFKADGGGDGPENVNQALYDAVHKVTWSDDAKTLKIIYLVGDYPPHNDYEDVQKYDKTAEEAIKKGIYINTILCGNNDVTQRVWLEIADASEGSFFAIGQSGDVIDIPTPYDGELAKLNSELVDTALSYGVAEEREAAGTLKASVKEMGDRPEAAASRAVFSAKAGKAVGGSKDLVTDADSEEDISVMLGEIKDEELPEEMQKMTQEEREKYVAEKKVKRDEVTKKIEELSKKRGEFIKEELEKSEDKKEGFDLKVIEALKKQAEKKGITYED